MPRARADAHLVMAVGYVERLREFAGTGAKLTNIVERSSLLHQGRASPRFERANQNEPGALSAFDQQIEHPVDAIIEINVKGAGPIAFDEGPGARPGERVAGFIVQRQIRLGFDNDSGTFSPDQFRANEFTR